MKSYTQRGFTLMELLVVIAIIGILASVVLASLNTARAKGADSAIKANLANIRAQGEIIYDGNTPNSYSGICLNATVVGQMNGAKNASGAASIDTTLATAGLSTTVECHVSAANDVWLISAPLKATAGTYWCVDSTGASKQEAAPVLGGATACL